MVMVSVTETRRRVLRETTGERIRRLRLERGWTQRELSDRAGLGHPDKVGRAERDADIFAHSLAGMAEAFGVTLDYLWAGRGEP